MEDVNMSKADKVQGMNIVETQVQDKLFNDIKNSTSWIPDGGFTGAVSGAILSGPAVQSVGQLLSTRYDEETYKRAFDYATQKNYNVQDAQDYASAAVKQSTANKAVFLAAILGSAERNTESFNRGRLEKLIPGMKSKDKVSFLNEMKNKIWDLQKTTTPMLTGGEGIIYQGLGSYDRGRDLTTGDVLFAGSAASLLGQYPNKIITKAQVTNDLNKMLVSIGQKPILTSGQNKLFESFTSGFMKVTNPEEGGGDVTNRAVNYLLGRKEPVIKILSKPEVIKQTTKTFDFDTGKISNLAQLSTTGKKVYYGKLGISKVDGSPILNDIKTYGGRTSSFVNSFMDTFNAGGSSSSTAATANLQLSPSANVLTDSKTKQDTKVELTNYNKKGINTPDLSNLLSLTVPSNVKTGTSTNTQSLTEQARTTAEVVTDTGTPTQTETTTNTETLTESQLNTGVPTFTYRGGMASAPYTSGMLGGGGSGRGYGSGSRKWLIENKLLDLGAIFKAKISAKASGLDYARKNKLLFKGKVIGSSDKGINRFLTVPKKVF
jgi:hypothetical protein